MSGAHVLNEFKRYPGIKNVYLRAFEKMLKARDIRQKESSWETAEEVMNWWLKIDVPKVEGSIHDK